MIGVNPNFDWERIAYLVSVSRTMDHIEETELVPSKEVLYQFSARGHDVAQIMLGSLLDKPHDATCGYYRSRPMLLCLGVDLEDAMAGPLAKSGGYSDGRDIGVVFNLSLIHISEPTRRTPISYAVFCLKKRANRL